MHNALHLLQDPTAYFRNEPPVELHGASASPAGDYAKRQHVFRLKLANGAEYLYLCRDQDEMNRWVTRISEAVGQAGETSSSAFGAARAQTMPATSTKSESRGKSEGRDPALAAAHAPALAAEAPAAVTASGTGTGSGTGTTGSGSGRTPQREQSRGKEVGKGKGSFTAGKKK